MEVIANVAAMRTFVAARRRRLGTGAPKIVFVPTMGCLHDGHMSLVHHAATSTRHDDEAAVEHAVTASTTTTTITIVSIFVNPTQFGPTEDFDKYPRPLDRDLELCRLHGVAAVFAPTVAEMYPDGFPTSISVLAPHDATAEGRVRPFLFSAIATVVLKLLNIVQPDVAVFGQKDAAQCATIRQLARDLNVPCEIQIAPTVRETTTPLRGLATSSRNTYLSTEQREWVAPLVHLAMVRCMADLLQQRRQIAQEIIAANATSTQDSTHQLATVAAAWQRYVQARFTHHLTSAHHEAVAGRNTDETTVACGVAWVIDPLKAGDVLRQSTTAVHPLSVLIQYCELSLLEPMMPILRGMTTMAPQDHGFQAGNSTTPLLYEPFVAFLQKKLALRHNIGGGLENDEAWLWDGVGEWCVHVAVYVGTHRLVDVELFSNVT